MHASIVMLAKAGISFFIVLCFVGDSCVRRIDMQFFIGMPNYARVTGNFFRLGETKRGCAPTGRLIILFQAVTDISPQWGDFILV